MLALSACADEPTTPPPARAESIVPSSAPAASVASNTVGEADDIGSFGFGGGAIFSPLISDNGDVVGLMPGPTVNTLARWSPVTRMLSDLGSGDCQQVGWVADVNASGQITGILMNCPRGQYMVNRAFRWSPQTGQFELLSPPPSSFLIDGSEGEAIGEDGTVIGWGNSISGVTALMRWVASSTPDVGHFPGTWSQVTADFPMALNTAGIAVGTVAYVIGLESRQSGWRWAPGGAPEILSAAGYTRVAAVDINAQGTVVGTGQTAAGDVHLLRWEAGSIEAEDLGTLGNILSVVGISDAAGGEEESIAVMGYLNSVEAQGFRWTRNGGFEPLGPLPSVPPESNHFRYNPTIYDISSTAAITGSARAIVQKEDGETVDEEHAFLWRPGEGYTDLGALTGTASRGQSVNAKGQVAGFWFGHPSGHRWARWTPGNRVPVVGGVAPVTGSEGSPITLDASEATDPDGDPLSFAWDVDSDGEADITASAPRVDHIFVDDGEYPITVTVTDGRGGSATATTTATIANVAPAVSTGSDRAIEPGTELVLSATITDPGSADSPWSYAIDWGDDSEAATGTLATLGPPLTASHAYAAGSYTVRVTVTDKDGASGTGQFTLTVAPNRAPTAVITAPASGAVGAAIAFSGASSSDPDGDALTYAWNFGDGSTATGATPTHTFQTVGSYTVTLTVSDGRGASHAATHSIAVTGVALNVIAAFDGVPATDFASLLRLRVTNPGGGSSWTAGIDWGDGTTDPLVALTRPDGALEPAASRSHTFAQYGLRSVVVTVTDNLGQSGTVTLTPNIVLTAAMDAPDPCVSGGKGKEKQLCRRAQTGGLQYGITLYSEPGFEPITVDVQSVRLGDGVGSDAAPLFCNRSRDLNGDKVHELACAFDLNHIIAEVPHRGAQTLILRANFGNGFRLRAADAVGRL
ncbi:MAG TPA: PKD domain-containing protein [Gemmatimonadales bacterium]